jgi:surface antigen
VWIKLIFLTKSSILKLLMLKQKLKFVSQIRALLLPVFMGVVLGGTTLYTGIVRADQYDEQIQTLQQQNSGSRAASNQLAAQANSYEDAINSLQDQINSLQQAIVDNQNKSNDLQNQINAKQTELDHQKQVLGENIKTMYVEGKISTLEILASSNNISDFVNKETYRTAMRNQIKTTVDTITQLKTQLQKQQDQLQGLIKEQQAQQAQLNSAQLQQSQMLAYTQGQKAAFDQQIKANNAQISSLRAQQLAFYNQITGGGTRNYGSSGAFQFRNLSAEQDCGGGYSYCWAGFDQWVSDTWGLHYARECVHYAADRAARGVDLSGYLAGRGNANQWPSSLGGAYRVDQNPEVGAVAITTAFPSGHAMYVEYVLDDGWVGVSQMNWDVRGHYSTMEVKASGVWFIHFN